MSWWHSGSCDANASANGITWPKRCASKLNSVDLRNSVVQMVSHDANGNDFIWWNKWCAPLCSPLDVRNSAVALTVPLVWCHVTLMPMVVTWPKRHVAHHFYYLDLRNAVVAPTMFLTSHYVYAKKVTWFYFLLKIYVAVLRDVGWIWWAHWGCNLSHVHLFALKGCSLAALMQYSQGVKLPN